MPSPATPAALAQDPKRGSIRALRALNFFCGRRAKTAWGPAWRCFCKRGPGQVGTALAAGNIAQVLAQMPAGAFTDCLRQKRALRLDSIALLVLAVLATAFFTTPPVVMGGQALVGVAGAIFRLAWRPLRWGWWEGRASTRPRAPTRSSTRLVLCLPPWRWGAGY